MEDGCAALCGEKRTCDGGGDGRDEKSTRRNHTKNARAAPERGQSRSRVGRAEMQTEYGQPRFASYYTRYVLTFLGLVDDGVGKLAVGQECR